MYGEYMEQYAKLVDLQCCGEKALRYSFVLFTTTYYLNIVRRHLLQINT